MDASGLRPVGLKCAGEADGVEILHADREQTVLSVGSGRYQFAGRVGRR